MIVRLKVLVKTNDNPVNKFQFYDSPIKSEATKSRKELLQVSIL